MIMKAKSLYALAGLVLILSACGNEKDGRQLVLTSLLGTKYYEPVRSEKVQARLDSNLNVAKANWEKDPSEENYIWYGRRLGYLSRFQQAIDVLTEGIAKFPNSAKLYRHRGHRYISMRNFDLAIEDLTKASTLMPAEPLEIEPDGIPNSINTPLSSTQFNVWYHLGLAYYLKGDYVNAEKAYDECWKTCVNDDLRIACIDWMYMNYRRGRKEIKADNLLRDVTDTMKIVENDSYYKRCLMYKGLLASDSVLKVTTKDPEQADLALATQGYGVGNFFYYNGNSSRAKVIFDQVVAGRHFGAFGFIAAEAELARWQDR